MKKIHRRSFNVTKYSIISNKMSSMYNLINVPASVEMKFQTMIFKCIRICTASMQCNDHDLSTCTIYIALVESERIVFLCLTEHGSIDYPHATVCLVKGP